jgi:hypothetical protein
METGPFEDVLPLLNVEEHLLGIGQIDRVLVLVVQRNLDCNVVAVMKHGTTLLLLIPFLEIRPLSAANRLIWEKPRSKARYKAFSRTLVRMGTPTSQVFWHRNVQGMYRIAQWQSFQEIWLI